MMPSLLLSQTKARVIAVLAEKSITTPQYYPMTVNAVMLAANQKSSRSPIMQLTEGEVGSALNHLEQDKLCIRDSLSGRVQKWRHQFQHHLLLKPPTFAVLLTVMLRGPQTMAELRAHAAVLGGPTDAEGLSAALETLNDRAEPLVVLLPRASGQKESRYAHTLCGAPEAAPFDSRPAPESLRERRPEETSLLTALEQRLAELEARVAVLEQGFGIG